MLLLSPCFISSMSLRSLYNCSLPFLSFCSVCGKPKSNLNSQMISIFYFRCSSLLSTSSPFIIFAVLFRYTVHSHLIRHFLSWCYIWHCYFIVSKRNLVFTCNCSNLSAGNQKTLEHWGKIHYSRKKNCHQNWISAISQILCLIESGMRGWYKDSDHLKPLLTTTPYYSILINLIIHHSPQFPPPSHFTHPLFSLFLKYFFHSRASFTNFFFTFFSPCLSFPFALLIILSLNLPGFHSLCLLYDFYVLHHPPSSWLLNLHLANQEKNVLNKPRPCQRCVIQWDLSMCSIPLISIDSSSGGFCDPSLIGPDNALWLVYGWDQYVSDKQEPDVCECVLRFSVLANESVIVPSTANQWAASTLGPMYFGLSVQSVFVVVVTFFKLLHKLDVTKILVTSYLNTTHFQIKTIHFMVCLKYNPNNKLERSVKHY